jgi:hypothetical protein
MIKSLIPLKIRRISNKKAVNMYNVKIDRIHVVTYRNRQPGPVVSEVEILVLGG